VIVEQIHVKHAAVLETKDDPPIAGNIHGVKAFQVPREVMQAIARTPHMRDLSDRIEVRQNDFDFLDMVWRNLAAIATLIQALQSTMSEASYHSKNI